MRFALVGTVVALAVPAAALASHDGALQIDHYVHDDGTGVLIANPGGHDLTWQRCEPNGGPCSAHDDGDGNVQRLVVGDDPVGSVFQATSDGATVRSETWRGRVHATKPPRVDGEMRVGGHVVPVPATWEGGWGRETDWFQLQACEGADGTTCTTIADSIKYGTCPPGTGRYLPARYEGWWLKVADARIDRNQPFTREGYSRPEGVKPLGGAPGIATAVVGRIAPGPPPDEAQDCGTDRFGTPPVEPPSAFVPSPSAKGALRFSTDLGIVGLPGRTARVSVVLPDSPRWERVRGTRPGRPQWSVRGPGRACRVRVAVTPHLLVAPDVRPSEHVQRRRPESFPALVSEGTHSETRNHDETQWKLLARPGPLRRVALWAARQPAPPKAGVPAGQRVWSELRVTAVATRGMSRCPSEYGSSGRLARQLESLLTGARVFATFR